MTNDKLKLKRNSSFVIRNSSFRSGIALLLTVVLLSAILSVGIGIFNLMFGQTLLSGEIGDSFKAFFASDEVVERTLYRDRKMVNEICRTGLGVPCHSEGETPVASSACYTLRVSKEDSDGNGQIETTITAIGQFRCGPNPLRFVKRAYEAFYEAASLKAVTIESTTDNTEEVYVDGVLRWTNSDWPTRTQTTLFLTSGDHVLAYKVTNVWNSGLPNPASTLVSVRDASSVLFRSAGDGTWRYTGIDPTGDPNWNTLSFDDSSWGTLVFVGDFGVSPWGSISGWADTAADWIWFFSGAISDAPEITPLGPEPNSILWIRRTFNVP